MYQHLVPNLSWWVWNKCVGMSIDEVKASGSKTRTTKGTEKRCEKESKETREKQEEHGIHTSRKWKVRMEKGKETEENTQMKTQGTEGTYN